jgi:hypothetical protein
MFVMGMQAHHVEVTTMERLDQRSLSSFNKASRDRHVPPVLALVPPAPQAGALPKSYLGSFLKVII